MDLLTAAKKGDKEGARALIAGGAKVDAILKKRCSALGFVAADGDLAAVRLLLELGASPNPKKAEESPLELAFEAEEPVFEEIALLLLEHGAAPNVNDAAPLRSALIFGFDRAVEAMLARGVDVTVGEPVADAAGAGSLRWVKKLVELGADPDAGWALGQAMREDHVEVVAYLLERAQDFDLDRFFHYDFERASGPMAELVKKQIQWGEAELGDLLIEAILDNGDELATFALEGLRDADRVGRRGLAPLHAAVLARRLDWVERLLAKGASAGLPLPTSTKHNSLEISAGATALTLATQIHKIVKKERGDVAVVAGIEARLASVGTSQKKAGPTRKAPKAKPAARAKGPAWRVAVDDVLVKVAEAGGNDVNALVHGLSAIDAEGLDSWTYLRKATKRCGGELFSEAVQEKLSGTLLVRVIEDRLFEGSEWDDAHAKYYPKDARTAIRKGFVLSAWDAELFVLWPTGAGDSEGRVCHAHPESFSVLASSLVELLQREAATL